MSKQMRQMMDNQVEQQVPKQTISSEKKSGMNSFSAKEEKHIKQKKNSEIQIDH